MAVGGTMAELLDGVEFAAFPSTAMAVPPLAVPLVRRLPLPVSTPLERLRTLRHVRACQRLLDVLECVQPPSQHGALVMNLSTAERRSFQCESVWDCVAHWRLTDRNAL